MSRNFRRMLESCWSQGRNVCVGLDSDIRQIPDAVKSKHSRKEDQIFAFNKAIIDTTAEYACAYKPNSAFYEAQMAEGLSALARTVQYLRSEHPEIPIILDAKRADIGNTNNGYVEAFFGSEGLDVDAVTVHPYLGGEALKPFLELPDKGVIVLVRTSNAGAGEFQDLKLQNSELLYQQVARQVGEVWEPRYGNCAVVVGATYPEELKIVRQIVGDMPILIPGIGAQGGDIAATVRNGRNSQRAGMIINASRSILYAANGADFAEAAGAEAKRMNDAIQSSRLAD